MVISARRQAHPGKGRLAQGRPPPEENMPEVNRLARFSGVERMRPDLAPQVARGTKGALAELKTVPTT
jgi:hypothetical protein